MEKDKMSVEEKESLKIELFSTISSYKEGAECIEETEYFYKAYKELPDDEYVSKMHQTIESYSFFGEINVRQRKAFVEGMIALHDLENKFETNTSYQRLKDDFEKLEFLKTTTEKNRENMTKEENSFFCLGMSMTMMVKRQNEGKTFTGIRK